MNGDRSFADPRVAAYRLAQAIYPTEPPFHPSTLYPEYAWRTLGRDNPVYHGVRELFRLLKMDIQHYGTEAWNPLGEIVKPGDKVVLKPNYLSHSHKHKPEEWEQVITHGAVVRAVLDYVLLALRGRGEVCVLDGPQLDSNWDAIVSRSGVKQVCEYCSSVSSLSVRLLDVRDYWMDSRGDVIYRRVKLPGDPAGAIALDLGVESRFMGHKGSGRYYGADYDQAETNNHHCGKRHEYKLAKTAVAADVFINLPKMKTHMKVGITLCLKNLVGINAGRNWLPHHTDGDPSSGGDQFPVASIRARTERWGIRMFQRAALRTAGVYAPLYRVARLIATPIWGQTERTIRNGNWYGNDTAWRMVHDINKCLIYSDGEAFPLDRPKRYFAIVDGVVAGDGNGPATPDRKEAGVLSAGFNPTAVDCATTRLMGFDPMKIPMLREAFVRSRLSLAPFAYSDIAILSNVGEWNKPVVMLCQHDCCAFRAPFGWRGNIEWDSVVEYSVREAS